MSIPCRDDTPPAPSEPECFHYKTGFAFIQAQSKLNDKL